MTTTTTAPATFKIGDEVTANPELFGAGAAGTVYVIEKVPTRANEKNYVAKPKDNPTGRGIKGPAYALLPYTGETTAAATEVPFIPTPAPGSVVRIANVPKIDPTTPYVVLGESRKGGVKVTKLGGDNGRYFPHIPLSFVTVVPLADLLA